MSGFNKNNKKARRALPEHDQVRLLDGLISGAGGGATASAYDGPLFSAPGHVPALAEVFENTRIALRKADQSGLDQISLVTSPQLAVKQFEIIQTLVGGAIACADTFRAYSAIAKLTAGAQQRQWALAWADVYKRSLFKSPEDYMRGVPVRITGDALPSKKLVGGKESLNFGSKHFILERDEISGWMCYTLYGRCEASFKSRVKEHLETAQRDATKAVGNFKDYVALREAIIACLPGMPDQLLTSTLRYAADNFYSAATMQGQRNERLVGLCKQATSTAVAVGKRLLSSLLQIPAAEVDMPAFAARTFSGSDLLTLAPFFGLSALRGVFINDEFITSAQTHTNAPLLVDAEVENARVVRTINAQLAQWDFASEVQLGASIQKQLQCVQEGQFDADIAAAVRRAPSPATEAAVPQLAATQHHLTSRKPRQEHQRSNNKAQPQGHGESRSASHLAHTGQSAQPGVGQMPDGGPASAVLASVSAISTPKGPTAKAPWTPSKRKNPTTMQKPASSPGPPTSGGAPPRWAPAAATCFRCGEPGHTVRTCKNAPVHPPCGKCKRYHFAGGACPTHLHSGAGAAAKKNHDTLL